MIETDIQLFLRHPIKKPLVPINQSSCLICFCYNFFDRAKETNMHEIISRRLSSQTAFKKIMPFLKKATLQKY